MLPTFLRHVRNADEGIHRITQLNTEQLDQNYAFNLNVMSICTTVPTHPAIDIISEHIITKNLYHHKQTATDIHLLLSIIVENTYFTYNGYTNKQSSGLPWDPAYQADFLFHIWTN